MLNLENSLDLLVQFKDILEQLELCQRVIKELSHATRIFFIVIYISLGHVRIFVRKGDGEMETIRLKNSQ